LNNIYVILFLAENFRFVASYVGRGGIWSLTYRDEGSDPADEASEGWDQGSEIRIPRIRDQG